MQGHLSEPAARCLIARSRTTRSTTSGVEQTKCLQREPAVVTDWPQSPTDGGDKIGHAATLNPSRSDSHQQQTQLQSVLCQEAADSEDDPPRSLGQSRRRSQQFVARSRFERNPIAASGVDLGPEVDIVLKHRRMLRAGIVS